MTWSVLAGSIPVCPAAEADTDLWATEVTVPQVCLRCVM